MSHLKLTIFFILLHSFFFLSYLSGIPGKKSKQNTPPIHNAISELTQAKDALDEAITAVLQYKREHSTDKSATLDELEKEEQAREAELGRAVAQAESEFHYCLYSPQSDTKGRQKQQIHDLARLIQECRGLIKTSPYGERTLQTAQEKLQKTHRSLSMRILTRYNGRLHSKDANQSPELQRRRHEYEKAKREYEVTAARQQASSPSSDYPSKKEESPYAKTPAWVKPSKTLSSPELDTTCTYPDPDPAFSSFDEKAAFFRSFSSPPVFGNSSVDAHADNVHEPEE